MASKPTTNRAHRKKLLASLLVAAPRSATDGILLHQAVADRLALHVTDLRCLQALAEAGQATAGELAERTGLTTGAVTRLVDRLVAAGWVRREHDTADRRKVIVTPVAEKVATIGPLYAGVAAGWKEIVSHYDDAELALVLDLFERLHVMSMREIARLRQPATD